MARPTVLNTRRPCLLFVVQATASMAETVAERGAEDPPQNKLAAAILLIQRVLEQFLKQRPGLDAGILAFAGAADGRPVLRSLLAGASAEAPLVPLDRRAALANLILPIEPAGELSLTPALTRAHEVVLPWLAEYPEGPAPLVVVLSDGQGVDDAVVRLCGSLKVLENAEGKTLLAHCLFTSHSARVCFASQPTEADLPLGTMRLFWELSSPLPRSSSNEGVRRAFSVNDLTAEHLVEMLHLLADRSSTSQPRQEPPPADGSYFLESRALWLHKGSCSEDEYEDAFRVDDQGLRAAVCDGAGSGIFSRSWAQLLAQTSLDAHRNLDDPAARDEWVNDCRRVWLSQLNFDRLRYTQQLKVRNTGTGATVLVLHLQPLPENAAHFRWRAWAVGDCCLFWIRDGGLAATFPAVSEEDFRLSTPLLSTRDNDPIVQPHTAGGIGKMGDFFLLATDAIAQLLLQPNESDSPLDWNEFWQVDKSEWRNRIERYREQDQIVNDDCTLLAVRLARRQAAST